MAKFAWRRMWPLWCVVIAACVIVIVCWTRCRGQTTVLLARHADRDAGQDQLNPAGTARAQELLRVAQKVPLAAIYVTEAQRTQQTAQPLATQLGLTPIQIASSDVQALVDDVSAHHRDQTVLVVGHSNTVPQIIAAFGSPTMPTIADNEFDNLFVLNLCRCNQTAKVVNLQYGAASP